MDVGIRELKARLSEYVERAARGESIRVTDRGTPRAILAPIPGALRLEQGLQEGWITRRSDGPPEPVARAEADVTVAQLLAEDRGE